MDTDKPFTDRIAEIYSVLALPVDADVLCCTLQESETMKETPFLKNALAKEVVLHDGSTQLRPPHMPSASLPKSSACAVAKHLNLTLPDSLED